MVWWRNGWCDQVDRIFYKIIWIVCAFWSFSGLLVCFHSAIYEARKCREQCGLTVSELWEFTVHTLYIVFLFVNNENNNFRKEIKHVVRASIASWKPRQCLWEFEHVKTLNCVTGFHWSALEFSQMFTSVFTRPWRHGKHVLFLKWWIDGM